MKIVSFKGGKIMQILEYFYQLTIVNEHFKERKVTLPLNETYILYGARGTGKSTLAIEYLSSMDEDEFIYIDCQDPIFALEDIDIEMLNQFIDDEDIELVVLDHYYCGFLESKPICKQLIVISRQSNYFDITKKLELYPLDYEEFLSFDNTSSATVSFNHFLKMGTLPLSAHSNVNLAYSEMRRFFYSSFDEDESRLMLILARHQGRRITTNQIYIYAKEYFRISKDRVYRTIKSFVDEKVIQFVDDIDGKGAKKMFIYDFAISKYLSKSQSFSVTFDSLIALALIKHGVEFRAIGMQGYIIYADELIIPSAFENEEQFWKKSYNRIDSYKKAGIKRVTIVSVSNQYSYTLSDIRFEAIPFYEWSILNG